MLTLTKTHFYGSEAFRITFDEWESFSSFGPFFDILSAYAAETGIEPRRIQLVYQYQFLEDKRKTEFYWDSHFTVYVFNIASFQYQKIYERLEKICVDLNRQLAEKRYFEKYGELPNHGRGFR